MIGHVVGPAKSGRHSGRGKIKETIRTSQDCLNASLPSSWHPLLDLDRFGFDAGAEETNAASVEKRWVKDLLVARVMRRRDLFLKRSLRGGKAIGRLDPGTQRRSISAPLGPASSRLSRPSGD
jgi:hypothetical protein